MAAADFSVAGASGNEAAAGEIAEDRERRWGGRLPEGCYARPMHALKARVEKGRLIVNEPTTLPEGAVVDLVVLSDDEEAMERELGRRIERAEAGPLSTIDEVIARVQASR